MRISANDIKSGNILDYEGELWVVSKNPEHTKPGKGGAYVQVEMKNLRTGNKLNQRFSSSESVEERSNRPSNSSTSMHSESSMCYIRLVADRLTNLFLRHGW